MAETRGKIAAAIIVAFITIAGVYAFAEDSNACIMRKRADIIRATCGTDEKCAGNIVEYSLLPLIAQGCNLSASEVRSRLPIRKI